MPVPERLKEEFIEDCSKLTTPALADKYGRAPSTVKEWRLQLYRAGELLWWPGIRRTTGKASSAEDTARSPASGLGRNVTPTVFPVAGERTSRRSPSPSHSPAQ